MIIFMDGFDSYANNTDLSVAYYSYSNYNRNNIGLGTTSGRFGQGGVIFNSYASMLLKSFTSPLIEIWSGFAFNVSNIQNEHLTLYSFLSNNGYETQLTYNPLSGYWAAWTGNNDFPGGNGGSWTPLTSGNYNIGNGSWHYIELHYKISNTNNGILELWVDGTQVFNNTSANTSILSSNIFYSIQIGSSQSNTAGLQGILDDWYIIDTNAGGANTGRLGDSRIETLLPVSDAGPNNGTPLVSGPHYEMVNAPQNNHGSTYITLPPTTGSEEVFGLNSLSVIPNDIWGVRVLNLVAKEDGGITYGNAVIRSSNVLAYGSDQQVLSSVSQNFGIFETDPNTGNAWTYSSINAANAGFGVTIIVSNINYITQATTLSFPSGAGSNPVRWYFPTPFPYTVTSVIATDSGSAGTSNYASYAVDRLDLTTSYCDIYCSNIGVDGNTISSSTAMVVASGPAMSASNINAITQGAQLYFPSGAGSNPVRWYFPTSFPTSVTAVIATDSAGGGGSQFASFAVDTSSITNSYCDIYCSNDGIHGDTIGPAVAMVMAVGPLSGTTSNTITQSGYVYFPAGASSNPVRWFYPNPFPNSITSVIAVDTGNSTGSQFASYAVDRSTLSTSYCDVYCSDVGIHGDAIAGCICYITAVGD